MTCHFMVQKKEQEKRVCPRFLRHSPVVNSSIEVTQAYIFFNIVKDMEKTKGKNK